MKKKNEGKTLSLILTICGGLSFGIALLAALVFFDKKQETFGFVAILSGFLTLLVFLWLSAMLNTQIDIRNKLLDLE